MQKTILVVEDDADFRNVIVDLLREAEYRVLEAKEGREALEVMKAHAVDLVLSDIQMPLMDGFELLKQIKAISPDRPKVVIMTGFSIYTKEDAIKAGAEAFLEKPGIAKTLLNLLSSIRFY